MKIKLLLISAMIALAGCTPSAKQVIPEVIPDGLSDCKFYVLKDSNGISLHVVRCPNSSTSVNWQAGKVKRQLTTVDG